MQRFLTDTTEELTQRNLKTPRGHVNVQSDLILKLQRENLYLKNQLFAMVHVEVALCRIQGSMICTFRLRHCCVRVI